MVVNANHLTLTYKAGFARGASVTPPSLSLFSNCRWIFHKVIGVEYCYVDSGRIPRIEGSAHHLRRT